MHRDEEAGIQARLDTKALNELAVRFAQTFEPSHKALGELVSRMVQACEPIQKAIAELNEQVSQWLVEYRPKLEQLSDAMRGFVTLHEHAVRALRDLGWPPILSLSPNDAQWIVNEYESKDAEVARASVETYLLDLHHDKTILAMLGQWGRRRDLKKRLPILAQAVYAHIEGNFWLSIPAMLTQIEGIVVDRWDPACERPSAKSYVNNWSTECPQWSADLFASLVTDVLFESFKWSSAPPPLLNRHSVLHGHDVSYGTAANSLRAILVFDYLQSYFFGLVRVAGGTCYHYPTCRAVRGKELVRLTSRSAAKSAGLSKCRICQPE